jgi:hypothetical protein
MKTEAVTLGKAGPLKGQASGHGIYQDLAPGTGHWQPSKTILFLPNHVATFRGYARFAAHWHSDARRTSLDIAAQRDSSTTKLLQLFGKLELRYAPTHCHSTLNGQVTTSRHRVVAKDSSSVALVVSDALAGEQIAHLHFEGNRYWIVLGSGRMREFFKRVSPKRARRTDKLATSR